MNKLSGKLRLRPTRIGFLLRPSDMPSLRRIMRLCACLWGGTFNPLIPVCRAMPNVWEKDNHSGFKGMALTRGYIRFFEPDVYVEAKPGLAAECGINKDSGSPLFKRVVTLEDFVTYRDGRSPEFAFSLNILDVYRELYLKEYRFESKHPRQVVLFEGSGPDGTFAEALSGAFPEDEGLSFIRRGFPGYIRPGNKGGQRKRLDQRPATESRRSARIHKLWVRSATRGLWEPTFVYCRPQQSA